MNREASTAVKTAAIVMMAPVLLAPFKTEAQQMALGGPNFAACEQIKDPAKSAQCTHDATMEDLRRRNDAALARAAAADREGQCADFIKAEVAAGRIKPDAVRATLAGRPAREFGACNLVAALTRS